MQGHLAETDQVESDPVVEHAFRREPQEVLLHVVVARAGGQDQDLEVGPLQVAVDPVFFERVEREVHRFEDWRLVRVRESARELLRPVWTGSEKDGRLPPSQFERDVVNDRFWRGRSQV